MSTLQRRVIQSLNGLSDDNLQFLLDMIQRFMKPAEVGEKTLSRTTTDRKSIHRIGSLECQNLIDADYVIDECNGEIMEMFGVMSQ